MRELPPARRLRRLLQDNEDILAIIGLVVVAIGCFLALLWLTDQMLVDVVIHASGTV